MTKEKILSITNFKELFNKTEEENKSIYKNLAKQFHPDENKEDTTAVFMHIAMLYEQTKTGCEDNYVELIKASGQTVQIKYLAKFQFGMGVCYVCKNHIVYLLDEDREKYYKNAIARIQDLQYADEKMKAEFSRIFPQLVSHYQTKAKKFGIVLSKTEDVYPLCLLNKYFNGKLPDRHVAWILSRLNNMNCYFDYSGLVHNGIDLDSCFVSTKYHTVLLLGGWWYTTKKEEKMIGTTKEIFDIMPIYAKSNKTSKTETDIESVKLLGRILLGEANCRKFNELINIPKPIREFLTAGSCANAIEEMQKWDKTLFAAYGERKFIQLETSAEEIYNLN